MSDSVAKRTTTVIDLLRHGECEDRAILRGQIDSSLSDDGLLQMQQVAHQMNGSWQHVVSSPLQRCSHFSRWLSNHYQLPLSIEAGLMEMDFGDWDGLAKDVLWKQHRKRLEQFYECNQEDQRAPNGESLMDFRHRIMRTWRNIMCHYKGQHILTVQHAGTIRIILSALFNISLKSTFQFDIAYASLSRIRVDYHEGEPYYRLIFLGSPCTVCL